MAGWGSAVFSLLFVYPPRRRSGLQCSRILVPSYTGPGMSLTRIRPLVSLPWASGYLGLNTSSLSFTRFRSPYHRPLVSGPKAHVRPQEKKSARCCLFESHNDSEFIARNSALYRPKLALNYISCDQYVTSGVGFLVPSYIHFRHWLFYTSFTLIIVFLVPLSFVPSSLYTNTIFNTLLIGFFVPSSLVPLSLVPSSHAIINNSDLSH